jgi:hypothetical protein
MEHTKAGDFPGLLCEHPNPQPFIAAVFFISFVLVAAFVIMALFVGAVCGGMYEALDDFKLQEEEEAELREKELAEEEDASEFYKLQTFRDTFDVLDKDCSGLIDAQELTYVMKLIGVQVCYICICWCVSVYIYVLVNGLHTHLHSTFILFLHLLYLNLCVFILSFFFFF